MKNCIRHRIPGACRRRRSFHPAIEGLEERAVPAVFNVNSLADVLNPGHGIVTLRAAIEAANATPGGNFINLTVPGTYKITLAGTLNEADNAAGAFAILPTGGDLVIRNTSNGAVIVDGNHLNRVFDINPAFDPANPTAKFTVTLQGLTIQNGVALDPVNPDGPNSSGGGIRDVGNASLTLNNVTVTNNTASADGGGIAMENTVSVPWTLTVNNSVISDNHAGDAGGGIDEDGSGKVFINPGTVITGNTTVNQGGGIWLDAIAVGNLLETATVTVVGATITNNSALTGPGGGIGNAGVGAVTIVSSTIANNFAGLTGGGFGDENNVGSLVVINSVFVGNVAVGAGGGIQEGGPLTSITNTEIVGNSSGATGGGIFASGTTLYVQNSTIASNTAAGIPQGSSPGGGGIELQTTGTGLAATTIINTTITGNQALNSAGVAGGGIDAVLFSGELVLVNDTINANFASAGGGILWGGLGGSVAIASTLIADNIAASAPDALSGNKTFTDLGGNLIGIATNGSGLSAATTQSGTAAAPLNALLAPLGYYGGPMIGAHGSLIGLQTEPLGMGSPAIGKGLLGRAPAYDERGVMHLLTSSVNVGAVSAAVTLPSSPTVVHTNLPLISQTTTAGVTTTVYLVNSTLDTHTPAAGTLTLRHAIDLANQTPGDKIIELLVPGVYGITLPGANTGTNASGAFAILPSGGNVKIVNASRGTVTVNGNGLDRAFDINPVLDVNFNDEFTVTLSGLTITGGIAAPGDGAAGSGGGIRDQGIASLTLNNDVITGNIATADGGGVAMENTVNIHWILTLNNTIVANNHAGDAGGGVETDGAGKVFVTGGGILNNLCVNQGAGIWLDAITDANVMDSAALSVTNTLIRGNIAQDMLGGGIGNAGNGAVSIFGSTIEDNFSGGTGGGFADSNNQGTLAVTNSVFLGNVALADGGGIQEGGPTTTLTRSEIDGNQSGATGGGVFATGTTLTVLDSTIANNLAAGNAATNAGGGGIELETSGDSTITTSTIVNNRALNSAGVHGGGIDAQALAGALMLLNDTISGNFASQGGGIDHGDVAGSSVTLQNTIVALNLAPTGAGVDLFNANGFPFHDGGGNFIGVEGDAGAGIGGDFGGLTSSQAGTIAQPLNPLLAALGYYGGPSIGAPGAMLKLQTEALLAGSHAIGKGVTTGAPSLDERGDPLLVKGTANAGAVGNRP